MMEMIPQLPLDFSRVKTESSASVLSSMVSGGVGGGHHHNKGEMVMGNMLLAPEKGSTSAFKVVTPKNSDGKLCLTNFFFPHIFQ